MPQEQKSRILELPIFWRGPYTTEQVIHNLNDGGSAPAYTGEDYGLYQIYGAHILGGTKSLLYIGKATQQTFSARFQQHQAWLQREDAVQVYVGRIDVPERHISASDWATWAADAQLAECILIYKYSPHYNSVSIAEPPRLAGFDKVMLAHNGERYRLDKRDIAPDDWL